MESNIRLIGGILLLFVFGGLKADPYAEWAGWGDAWMKKEGKEGIKLKPPGAPPLELRHVGIPPYPGAKLTVLGPNGGHSDNDCLLMLGTNDDGSKIIDFYKTELDSDSFEFFKIFDQISSFVNKENPRIGLAIVERKDEEDQFGFTKTIIIHFKGLQGYTCTKTFSLD